MNNPLRLGIDVQKLHGCPVLFVKGEIDIYMPSDAAAKRFGRRTVKVEVLSRGEGR